MKIRFERNRRYIFIEMKSLFLNFLDLILCDTSVASLRFKDENRRELCYHWNWILRFSYLSNLQMKKKIAEVTKMQFHQVGSHNLWLLFCIEPVYSSVLNLHFR